MAKLTRDQWLVYSIFRAIKGREKAEEYKRKASAKNRHYGVNVEATENPWKLAYTDDYDTATFKRFFPGELTEEERAAIIEATWIDCPNTQWDCTGKWFSSGISFYRVPGGFWVYHFMACDV